MLDADLVIGAVLVPGAKAPTLVTNELVSRMKPGSVLVDISIDQGGCFEDSRPTTHADPTYQVHDSVFYCVANMPGAVPHTSTYALTNVTLPYAVELANRGWRDALRGDPALALGLNTHDGAGHLRTGRRGARHALDRAGRGPVADPAGERAGGRTPLRPRGRGLPRPPHGRARPGGQHAAAYRRDLRRYLRVPRRRAATTARRGHERRRRRVPARRCARATRTTRRWLPSSAAAHGGRGPRLAPVRAAGGLVDADAAPRRPPAGAAAPAAQGDPGRATSSGCSRRPGAGRPRRPLRDRALLELLYGTGARISEAVGLDVDDLDLDERRGRCCAARAARSGSSRSARTRGAAVDAYLVRARPGSRPAGRGTPALFLNARGGRLSRQSAWTVLREAAERAGLDGRTSRRTRCGTRSPPTCSTAARTSGSCRSCSGTPR